MTQFVSIVRCKTKPGCEENFIKNGEKFPMPKGAITHTMIKTGESTYCSFTIWEEEQALVDARPEMIAFLDTIRGDLEELSPDLGVTDPVSGPVVFTLDPQ